MSSISVVLLLLVALLAVSHSKRRPFRSVSAPAEIVEAYSLVVPEVRPLGGGDGPYPKALQVVIISTDEFQYTLLLQRNDVLIAPTFTSHSFDGNGNIIATKGHTNCYYQGKVKERSEWRVVVNLCSGLQGTFGMYENEVAEQHNLYHIEPLDHNSSELTQPHAVCLDTEFEIISGTCGSHTLLHSDHMNTDINNFLSDKMEDDLTKLRETRESGELSLFVELVMVNDQSQYNLYSRNLEDTVRRSLDIANHMNSLYSDLNVTIALVNVITWTVSDVIPVMEESNILISNFRDYVNQVLTQYDAAMLITHTNLTGSALGTAFTGTICSSNAVGVAYDEGSSVARTGAIAAHQLGHNLNMNHDSDSCDCEDGGSMCIMAGVFPSPPPTHWSQCNVLDLNTGLNGPRNLDRCLLNKPASVIGEPTCGNNIREDSEDCDCGSPLECTNPCCNANTCRLASSAQCSTGPCCNMTTCQLQSYGTLCRSSTGSCDIEEYCTGESDDCPTDTYLTDGSTCNNNNDYCYKGTCQTLDSQCQFHFNTSNGDSRCYSNYNTLGDHFGNCGYNHIDYIPCSASNVGCGLLFCLESGTYQGTTSANITEIIVTVPSSVQCKGFTGHPGSGVVNPGLVADGTRCGNGWVCYFQQCIEVSTLPTLFQCPFWNGRECAGNGQCNQFGECSCDVGFVGIDCSSTTSGPAVTNPSLATPQLPTTSEEMPSTSPETPQSARGNLYVNVGASVAAVVVLLAATAIVISVTVLLSRKKKRKDGADNRKDVVNMTSNVAYVSSGSEFSMTINKAHDKDYVIAHQAYSYSYAAQHTIASMTPNTAYSRVHASDGTGTAIVSSESGDHNTTSNVVYGVSDNEVDLSCNVAYMASTAVDDDTSDYVYDYVGGEG